MEITPQSLHNVADINSVIVGPTTGDISYSTVTFTPAVFNKNLEVYVNLTWLMHE